MQEFNRGVYDYLIASDESVVIAEHDADDQVQGAEQEECSFSLFARVFE